MAIMERLNKETKMPLYKFNGEIVYSGAFYVETDNFHQAIQKASRGIFDKIELPTNESDIRVQWDNEEPEMIEDESKIIDR
jgi:hypothetical protein